MSSCSDCRRSAADNRIGLLVEYWKKQKLQAIPQRRVVDSSLSISPQRAGLEAVP